MKRKDLYDLAMNTLRFAKDVLAGNSGLGIAKKRVSVSILVRKSRKDWIEAEIFPDGRMLTKAYASGKERLAREDRFLDCLDVNKVVEEAWGMMKEKANG